MQLWVLSIALADTPAPFTCCDDPVVEKVVGAWLDVSDRLSEGKAPSDALSALAKAADTKGRPEDTAVLAVVETEARRLVGADVVTVRAELEVLARHVLWLSLRHESGPLKVIHASCPGLGSWVQRDRGVVINPYGVACGSLR